MRRLHSGDVIVADANVFNDFLSRLGVPREQARDVDASLRLLDAVQKCCARFGYTKPLLSQYLTSEPAARPILGGQFERIAELVGKSKLFFKPVSAGERDDRDPREGEFPPEDRFLLDVAIAVNATFLVTTDHKDGRRTRKQKIPLGERRVAKKGGGALDLEVIEPAELIERIAWPISSR
jgi:hypothetical protein